jgi:hypothetical protein
MKTSKRFVELSRLALAVVGVAVALASAPMQALAQAPRPPMLINVATGKALDVFGALATDQAVLQQFTPHGGDNQRWLIRLVSVQPVPAIGLGLVPTYAIIAAHSGLCVDVPGGSTAPGTGIQQFSCHFGDNQRWVLLPTNATNQVVIVNVHSGLCLDIAGQSNADQARVVQQPFNQASPYQLWRITP